VPFDMFALAAVTDEISERAVGGQVQRIVQPGDASIGLGIYSGGVQHWLLLSADAAGARVVFVADKLAKAFPTPSPFVMLLRKYLEGRRLASAEQVPEERVLILRAAGEDPVRLVAEVMGKHSNIMLLDASDRILGALKNVPPRQSRVRPILPGRTYAPPPQRERDDRIFPPGSRVDPAADPDAALVLLSEAPGETAVRAALLGLFPGAGPFLTDQIADRAGSAPEAQLTDVAIPRVVREAAELYRMLNSRDWQPHTFMDRRGRCDYAPYRPVAAAHVTAAASMSAAVESCVGGAEAHDALAAPRAALLKEVERARNGAERRVASMRAGLEASAEAAEAKQRGQLILAYSYAIAPGAPVLSIPEMGLEIPLDATLTPQGNAERAFRRYTKLRDAAARLPGLIAEAEAEAARLADLTVFVSLADSEAALRDLQREITPMTSAPARAKSAKRGPLRFRRGPYEAIAGRNARENEEVTFRLAGRDDLWLHARDRTGAHIILRQGASAPEEVIAAAGALAAYYSEGRGDTRVSVVVTSPRNVRKIPGGPQGRVRYQNESTVTVKPDLTGWEPVAR
jgi:predicted ribosome quality control (RQC) complex YloA/Tae2 family protein